MAWGINPNLLEAYPDLIAFAYSFHVTPNETFTADASAASYMNTIRIRKDFIPLFVSTRNQELLRV